MNKLLIEGEGLNKFKALKEKKIIATKKYLESKNMVQLFPKDKEFWEKFVCWIEQKIRSQNLT